MVPANQELSTMTDNLALAQQIAWDLATTLMVSVTLFTCEGRYGVLPSAEFDGPSEAVLTEFDLFDR